MQLKNAPPQSYLLVREERLLEFCVACFEKAGLEPEHAQVISRLLVNSDLHGVRSHGSRSLNGYAQAFARGKLNPNPNIRPIDELPAVVAIDGDGTLGYWPMVQAAEAAVAKAKAAGVGLATVRHIGHYGSAGHYARICQGAGCVGFSVQGYRNEAKPKGESEPKSVAFSGDPPMCFALPAGETPGLVLDGGANIFGFYNRPGYDDQPQRLPGAFFRSIGLVGVATLLGGALTGFSAPVSDKIEARWPGAINGGMVLAIDVAQMVDGDRFVAEADRYARDLAANHRPLPGTDQVQLPGAVEAQRLERYRREGIPYGEEEQRSAGAASQHFGVALPWD